MGKNKVYGYKGKFYRLKKKFMYTGAEQEFNLDPGKYLLVCNGACGGMNRAIKSDYDYYYETYFEYYDGSLLISRGNESYGSPSIELGSYYSDMPKGGTSMGVLNVDEPLTLYAVVGGNGGNSCCYDAYDGGKHFRKEYKKNGGYNGGGGGGLYIPYTITPYKSYLGAYYNPTVDYYNFESGAGGGGATDIRTMKPNPTKRTVTKKRLPDRYQEVEYLTSCKPDTVINTNTRSNTLLANGYWMIPEIVLNYVPLYESEFNIQCMFYSNIQYKSHAYAVSNRTYWVPDSTLVSCPFQDDGNEYQADAWTLEFGPLMSNSSGDSMCISFVYGTSSGVVSSYDIQPDQKILIEFDTLWQDVKYGSTTLNHLIPATWIWSEDGELITSVMKGAGTANHWNNSIKPLELFGTARDTTVDANHGFFGRFYELEIREDDYDKNTTTVVRHYFPCYDKENPSRVGLYDIITDTFIAFKSDLAEYFDYSKLCGPDVDTMVTVEEEYDESLYSRFIVAGGGGGGSAYIQSPYHSNYGIDQVIIPESQSTTYNNHGGGTVGGDQGAFPWDYKNSPLAAHKQKLIHVTDPPADQSSGYAFGVGQNAQRQSEIYENNWRPVITSEWPYSGSYVPRLPGSGGGGGGWFGGRSQTYYLGTYRNCKVSLGGGGGSSYVLTKDSYKPEGYLLGEEFYLEDVFMSACSSSEPSIEIYEEISAPTPDDEIIFPCTGETCEFKFPKGTYRIKCYGAPGGSGESIDRSSRGGYAEGVLSIDEEKTLYINVGGSGSGVNLVNDGGFSTKMFNGGGQGVVDPNHWIEQIQRSGGGATDIRTMKPDGTTNDPSLYSRFIVAGGGGGQTTLSRDIMSSAGGGISGNISTNPNGTGTSYIDNVDDSIVLGPGTQTESPSSDEYPEICGGFGYGGNGKVSDIESDVGKFTKYNSAGGGGGWFGGSGEITVSNINAYDLTYQGAAGGSSYVLTKDSYKPEGYLLGEEFYLEDTKLITGGNTNLGSSGLIEIEILNLRTPILCQDDDGYKYYNKESGTWALLDDQTITDESFNNYGIYDFESDAGLKDTYNIIVYDETNVVRNIKFEVIPSKQTVSFILPLEYKNDKIIIDHDNPDTRCCSISGRKRLSEDFKNVIYDVDINITDDINFPVKIFGLETIDIGGRGGSKSWSTDASKIVEVDDYFSMFNLTKDDVNVDDIVKDLETGKLYTVIDVDNLNDISGYEEKDKQYLLETTNVEDDREIEINLGPVFKMYDREVYDASLDHSSYTEQENSSSPRLSVRMIDLRSNSIKSVDIRRYDSLTINIPYTCESGTVISEDYHTSEYDDTHIVSSHGVFHRNSCVFDDNNVYAIETNVGESKCRIHVRPMNDDSINGVYTINAIGISSKNKDQRYIESHYLHTVQKDINALAWLDETTLVACGDDHIIFFDTISRSHHVKILDGSMIHDRFAVGKKLIVGSNIGTLNCYNINTETVSSIELPNIDSTDTDIETRIVYANGLFYILYPDGHMFIFNEDNEEVIDTIDFNQYITSTDTWKQIIHTVDNRIILNINDTENDNMLVFIIYDISTGTIKTHCIDHDWRDTLEGIYFQSFRDLLIICYNNRYDDTMIIDISDKGKSHLGFMNKYHILKLEDMDVVCRTNGINKTSKKLTIRYEDIIKQFETVQPNVKKVSMSKTEYNKIKKVTILNE